MKSVVVLTALVGTLLIAGGDIGPAGENMDIVNGAGYEDVSQTTYSDTLVLINRPKKLMWQDEKYLDEEEGAYQNGRSLGKAGNWNHAEMYCRSLDYSGFIDWRLPTLNELMDLYGNKAGLQYSQTADFWASTPDKGRNYWSVYSVDGYSMSHNKDKFLYIRCVRTYEMKKRSSRSGRL